MNQTFFELESHQILEGDRLFYYDYYYELKRREIKIQQDELQIQQDQRKTEHQSRVKHILSTFHGTEIVDMLMKNLPANIFYDDVQNIDRDSVLNALRNTFTNANELLIESYCKNIYFKLFGIQSDEVMNLVPVYTPQFPPPENSNIMIVNDTSSEFFPHRFIYVRKCYDKMFKSIESIVKYSPVAVIGDPGIGKTTFMRYMFLRIKKEFKALKIYWEMESGQWIFYDGNQLKTGIQDIVNWSDDNVLVLVDGKLKPKYLKKQNNIILFCSPQPQNYMKLIKTYSGATFVMPCWDVEELMDFICTDEIVCTIMQKFYERMFNSLDSDEKHDLVSSQNEGRLIDIGLPEIGQIGFVDEYKEYERIKVLTKRAFLIEQVMFRYKLCGGKIRLLLHNQINFKLLKDQVIKSIHSLSLDDIKHQECLDLQHNVPSIIYSMSPVDFDSDPRDFKVGFASNYISEIASTRMVHEYSKKLNVLFAAMSNQRIDSSLVGQIFEKLVIESIVTKKLTELKGKILTGDNADGTFTLPFGDFVPQDYDANDKNLARLISGENSSTNHFFTPIQSNAAAVDAIYYMSSESGSKLYFLQMTISMFHDFKLKHLINLAKSFHKEATDIELVFVVPEKCGQSFGKQNALTANGQIMKPVSPEFRQSVLVVPKEIYASIN